MKYRSTAIILILSFFLSLGIQVGLSSMKEYRQSVISEQICRISEARLQVGTTREVIDVAHSVLVAAGFNDADIMLKDGKTVFSDSDLNLDAANFFICEIQGRNDVLMKIFFPVRIIFNSLFFMLLVLFMILLIIIKSAFLNFLKDLQDKFIEETDLRLSKALGFSNPTTIKSPLWIEWLYKTNPKSLVKFKRQLMQLEEKIERQSEDLMSQAREKATVESELRSAESVSNISRQVAHDIRSPLTALNMVMGAVKELPEEKRVLIRNAVQRINDIANNLLVKSKTPTASSTDHGINTGHTNTTSHKKTSHTNNLKLDTHLLSSLIDTIVSEKRIQFRDKINVHIEADLNEAYGLFARIDSQEFQRVISNLINNSVEALLDAKGEVTVSIRGYTNTILVVVFDNGKGIPQQLLAKLGEVGVSYGKEGTESGSGLGLAHAKKAIESFGGKFEIQSRVGEGTMVNITLTREQTPKWFVEEIRLSSNMQLVSVDDDVSIHQVWSGRFKSLHISEIIKHMSFTSIKSFMEWFARQATENNIGISNILFLVDYEFLNESMTGLDLIEKLNISKYAILITSRFDEPQIRVRCDSVGIKLIPKSMAGLVPIKVKPMLKREQKQLLNIILPDAILIDDDMLVHMTWNSFAKENNKKYAQYFSVEEFLKAQSLYDHTSPIFVDSNLGNNIKGEDAAKEIFKQGFKNIFIATGYEASSIVVHPWIKGVVGKDPQ